MTGPSQDTSPVTARRTLRGILGAVFLEHLALLRFAGGYLFIGGAVLLVWHRAWPIEATTTVFAEAWIVGSCVGLGVEALKRPRRRLRDIAAPERVLGALLIAIAAVPLQVTFQSLKQSIGPVIGFGWDDTLSAADVAIHGHQAWEWIAWLFDVPAARATCDVLYMLWFPIVLGFVIWLSWTNFRVLRQRALIAFMAIWAIGGTVLAALLASAGPVYQPSYENLASRVAGTIASGNQIGVMRASLEDQWLPFGGISAMPSMHVAVAVLMALTIQGRSRLGGWIAWTYACAIQIASVLLGWHYAIDGYVAIALTVGCWMLAARLASVEPIPWTSRS